MFTVDNIEETLNELRENIRIAYGLGVAVRIGQMARIELNYCIPLAYQRGDRSRAPRCTVRYWFTVSVNTINQSVH